MEGHDAVPFNEIAAASEISQRNPRRALGDGQLPFRVAGGLALHDPKTQIAGLLSSFIIHSTDEISCRREALSADLPDMSGVHQRGVERDLRALPMKVY